MAPRSSGARATPDSLVCHYARRLCAPTSQGDVSAPVSLASAVAFEDLALCIRGGISAEELDANGGLLLLCARASVRAGVGPTGGPGGDGYADDGGGAGAGSAEGRSGAHGPDVVGGAGSAPDGYSLSLDGHGNGANGDAKDVGPVRLAVAYTPVCGPRWGGSQGGGTGAASIARASRNGQSVGDGICVHWLPPAEHEAQARLTFCDGGQSCRVRVPATLFSLLLAARQQLVPSLSQLANEVMADHHLCSDLLARMLSSVSASVESPGSGTGNRKHRASTHHNSERGAKQQRTAKAKVSAAQLQRMTWELLRAQLHQRPYVLLSAAAGVLP